MTPTSPSMCPSPVFQRSVENYDEMCNPSSFEPVRLSPLAGVKRSASPSFRISRRCEMSPMSPLGSEPTSLPIAEEEMRVWKPLKRSGSMKSLGRTSGVDRIPLAEPSTEAGRVRGREEEEEESVPRLVRSCAEKWA